MFDQDTIIYYTEGHCHSLALAIHNITGWTVYHSDYMHAFVRTPCEMYLDIVGLQYDTDLYREWGGWPEKLNKPYEELFLWSPEPNPNDALATAYKLIRSYQNDKENLLVQSKSRSGA